MNDSALPTTITLTTIAAERVKKIPAEWLIAFVIALVHLAVAGRYDIFRNELYFIVCGRHPDFGFVDQPPLVPLLAAATQLFGDNPWLLRLPAAAAAAGLVILTAWFARLLGGSSTAAFIAGVAAGIAPALIALTTTTTTATFEPVAWTAFAYFLTRAVVQGDRRAVLWAGVVAGIAMQAKYGIAFWIVPLGIGVLLTSARRILTWPALWLGALVALLLGVPSLIWQGLHGWPFLEVHANHLAEGANFTGTPFRFEVIQLFAMNILLAPLWIAGVVAPLFWAPLKPARFLSVGLLGATMLVFLAHGKDYYLFPVYPSLFAVGAVVLAQVRPVVRTVWLAGALIVSLIVAPVVLPILDPPALAAYLSFSHLAPPPSEAAAVGAPLTQLFSDELGWRDLEKQVASIYHSLPAEERSRTAILAADYGEAAALDVYGQRDGLPPALCGQNQYFLWGARGYDGSTIIHVNGDPNRWRRGCDSVEVVGQFGVPYAMPYENARPIFICHGLRRNLTEVWSRLKRYQ
ncbi:MAG TPA: glycosyltransferase family 39 protein [Chthoniobacterales bacterium]